MRLFVALLVFALMALPVFALTIKWVEYNPNTERIIARVVNESDEIFNGINVVFYADGKPAGSYAREEYPIPPDSIITTYTNFTYDGKPHEFSAEVSSEEQTKLSEKTNNSGNDKTGDEQQENAANLGYLGLVGVVILSVFFFVGFVILKKKVFSGEAQ